MKRDLLFRWMIYMYRSYRSVGNKLYNLADYTKARDRWIAKQKRAAIHSEQ